MTVYLLWWLRINDENVFILVIKNLCANKYTLEDNIFDRLDFYYKTKVGRHGNTNLVRLEDDDILNEILLEWIWSLGQSTHTWWCFHII